MAHEYFGGTEINLDVGKQVLLQTVGVGATIIYTGIVTLVILKVLDVIMGLRVTEEQETEGLDISLHDERGFNL